MLEGRWDRGVGSLYLREAGPGLDTNPGQQGICLVNQLLALGRT
jgi:hypothetical protein